MSYSDSRRIRPAETGDVSVNLPRNFFPTLSPCIISMETEIFVSPEEDAEISTYYNSSEHPFCHYKRDDIHVCG